MARIKRTATTARTNNNNGRSCGGNSLGYGRTAMCALVLVVSLGSLGHINKKYRLLLDGSTGTGTDASLLTTASSIITKPTCLEVGSDNIATRQTPLVGDVNCLLDEPPSAYMELLMDVLVGLPDAGRCNYANQNCAPPHLPYDETMRRFGNDWPPYGYTMVGRERLANFRAAILEVNRNNIEGAIVECGVWRGGAMILAAAIQKELQQQQPQKQHRKLYLFDAFGSFGGYGKQDGFLAVSQGRVTTAFQKFHLYDTDNLQFVKGLFNETVPTWQTKQDPIAVLRVDGNFYASYQDVMYSMYENVPVGGIVIFDDIFHRAHKDVMQFWQDFRSDHELVEDLVQIDGCSGWFRKQKDVKVDQSKKRLIGLAAEKIL